MQRNCPICMKRHKAYPDACFREAEDNHKLLCEIQTDEPVPINLQHHPECRVQKMLDWIQQYIIEWNKEAS